MKILLYPFGGSGNHGCEAIVRSTVSMTGADAILASASPEEDISYGLDRCCRIIPERMPLNRASLDFIKAYFRFHLLGDRYAFDKLVFDPVFMAAEDRDLALSIGGDNYCYGIPSYLCLINRELRRKGVKTILWGCSIDPEAMTDTMMEDLKGYDWIVARESLSFEAIRAKGLDRISLFPDPAFILPRNAIVLPDGFVEGNTIGINASPLILSCVKDPSLVMANYERLIETVLLDTDMAIALVPHVVWAQNDDRQILGRLYERFRESGRIFIVQDRPAGELKDLLARCRFVVAARTHATIAALSECVPTLAVGYSTKALGIARDIFGETDAPVIDIHSLRHEDDLSNRFMLMVAEENKIRRHLQDIMPAYRAKAFGSVQVLRKLLQ